MYMYLYGFTTFYTNILFSNILSFKWSIVMNFIWKKKTNKMRAEFIFFETSIPKIDLLNLIVYVLKHIAYCVHSH